MTQQAITDAAVEAVARALAKADGKDPDAPAWVEGYGNRQQTWGICWRDQYVKKAEAAIAAMRSAQPTGWQPIETAPQGCMCLFADMTAQEARNWAFVDWVVGAQLCGDRRRTATHWMPLPEPPAAQPGQTP